jgi:putative Mg2+ transporter-C (MgtC) family protein
VAEPARIAAQVISGISFLGAGIIVKHGSTVKGLTTAAGIWATAGIGLAIGAGMYVIGLFSVLVVFLIQLIMHKIKFGTEGWVDTSLDFNVKMDKDYNGKFMQQISKWSAKLEEIEITEEDGRTYHYRVIVKISSDIPTEEIIHFLSDDERVSRFSVLPDIPY